MSNNVTTEDIELDKKGPQLYRCKLVRIVDADTLVCDIDLGLQGTLTKQWIRFMGIDTPESRTRNLEEKALGLAAKARTKELVGSVWDGKSGKRFMLRTYKEKGKYGRILGEPLTIDGESVCDVLIREGHAYAYWGGKKKAWT